MNNKAAIPETLYGNDAFSKYNSNKLYEDNILDSRFYPYIFDSWRSGKTYGLVDNKGYALIPKQSALRSYTNDNGVFQENLAFVVNAYEDLKKYQATLTQTNKFDANSSLYTKVNAVSSYKVLDDNYIPHVQNVYDVFLASQLTEDKKAKIDNIDRFMKELVVFLTVSSKSIPLTRSSYISSRWSPLELNGITINIAQSAPFSNLKNKVDSYINDPNFNTFLESAKRFGFLVDKNAPWRIVADLGSPVMADYYKVYGLKSADDVLNKFYFKAHESDIETLKSVLLSFWNAYVKNNVLNIKADFVGKCDKLFASVSINSQAQMSKFLQTYNDEWFIRFYTYIKILEANINISQSKFEAMYLEAVKLNKYVDMAAATEYIVKQITLSQRKQPQESSGLTDLQELITVLAQQQEKQPYQGIIF